MGRYQKSGTEGLAKPRHRFVFLILGLGAADILAKCGDSAAKYLDRAEAQCRTRAQPS